MATTTKRTSAKTKTAKAKTTKKASTTKKAPAKSAAAKKTSSVKVKSSAVVKTPRITTVQTLRNLNIFTVVWFLLLAIAAGFCMKDTSFQLNVGYLAKDDLAGGVLAPAARSVFDIELRWAVVGVMVLSAVIPLLYVTKLKNRYNQYVEKTRMNPYRWIDFAVTFGIIVEIIALLSGVQDIFVLKMVGGLVVISYLCALIAERQNNTATQPVTSAYYTGVIASILPWILITSYAVFTLIYGITTSPWHTYALYGVGVLGVIWVALNQRSQFKNKGLSYMNYERRYLYSNLFTKTLFAAVLIAGLLGL